MPSQPAGIARRVAAMFYESLLILAILLIGGMAFNGAASGPLTGMSRHLFQLYIFLGLGLYFSWCWQRGGQTLPMKAWKLRLVSAEDTHLSARQAILRYVLAWISVGLAGTGFLWAFFDPDRQFFHDRMAGTRIVMSS